MEPINPSDHVSSSFYQDTSKLKNMKGREGLEAAASEFEAMFIQMMLKSMRASTEALQDENSPFNSKEQKFYQEMADGQMASELAKTGTFGIAEAMVRQLSSPLKKNDESVVLNSKISAFSQPLKSINDKSS